MGRDASVTDSWFGSSEVVDRSWGRLFKWGCLAATMLALGSMFVFLLYVFNDALEPLTADPGWMATYATTVVLPVLVLAVYYYRRAPTAGRVAYTALGLPIVMVLASCGVYLLFKHVIPPFQWLALSVALLVSAVVVAFHARVRPDVVVERFFVLVFVPIIAVVGVPAISVDYPIRTPVLGQELFQIDVSMPELVPSLREVVLSSPVFPTVELTLLLTFALPIAVAVGWRVRRVRESDRDGLLAFGATVVIAASGLVVGPVVGVHPTTWIVFAPTVGGAIIAYAERVVRTREGVVGLAFPVVLLLGFALGGVLVDTLGFSGPNAWLDWGFLTSAHNTTPEDAGIYPTLVGSVLILVVIVVSAFPVGVGAAVYLEEYAADSGVRGWIVELIEVNIANLAGVPSVVYGVLGLAIFANLVGMKRGTALIAGLTVGLLILPIVIISAQEAIRSVPDSRRRASYAMGATTWQTVRNVVLPESMPGILTGTILALGRAIGETAPLLMIGVAAGVRISPDSFTSRTGAMPRQILAWSTEIDTEFRYGVLAAGVVTLLVVLLTMNATAIVLRNRYQRNQ